MLVILDGELYGWFNIFRYELAKSSWEVILISFVLIYTSVFLRNGSNKQGAEHPGKLLILPLFTGILVGLLFTFLYIVLPGLCLSLIAIWLFFSLTGILSALVLALVSGNWFSMKQSIKIVSIGFYIEQDKSLHKSILHVISRQFWQQPQTLMGHCYAMLLNVMGSIRSCDRFEDTLMISGKLYFARGISLGNFLFAEAEDERPLGKINLAYSHSEVVRTFRHEFGHYLQGRKCGWLYLFKIGLPSAIIQGWTETDADQRSDDYLMHHYGITPTLRLKHDKKAVMRCVGLEKVLFIAIIITGALYSGSYGSFGAFLFAGGLEAALNMWRSL